MMDVRAVWKQAVPMTYIISYATRLSRSRERSSSVTLILCIRLLPRAWRVPLARYGWFTICF